MDQNNEWTVEYYRGTRNIRPVEVFLLGLKKESRARLLWSIEQLRVRNLFATFPLVKYLKGELWELTDEYRSIVFAYVETNVNSRIVLLDGFERKVRKRGGHELEIVTALQRYKEYVKEERIHIHRYEKTCEPSFETAYLKAFWKKQMDDPDFQAVYQQEAGKKALWLQLAEARQASGLTK